MNYPSQIKYIVGNEACERFSFYGMRSILVIFMIHHLRVLPENAQAIYHLFAGAVYLLPLLGGYLADRYLGKYKTIMFLSVVYCMGHLCLSLFESRSGLIAGLALIALGSGGIKPCVSALVGDQFTDQNRGLMTRVFDLFYWSINFGSFFSSLLIPFLLTKYGGRVAFGVPGILMAVATLIFWIGRGEYVHVLPNQSEKKGGFFSVIVCALSKLSQRKKLQPWLDLAEQDHGLEAVNAAKAVISLFQVFITVSVFWALFDQSGSSWVLQAQQMNLHWLGMDLSAAQLQALNPIMVMLLIPFFSSVVYPAVEKMGVQVTPLRKMSAGMVLAGVSFLIVGYIQLLLDSGQVLSVGWQVLPYLIITCSEVMVSITGLEFAYTQAPPSMKSTIMGFWLITIFVGNLLDATVAKLNIFQGAMFFYFFAFLMFFVSLIFVFSASRYKVQNYIGLQS